VLVVGVDLAGEPDRTAVAVLRRDDGNAVVEDLRVGADDGAVLAALPRWRLRIRQASTPLRLAGRVHRVPGCAPGWQRPVPGDLTGQLWRRQLAWRRTEEIVRAATGIIPLSVAADRIGHAAMRCAGLLAGAVMSARDC
jgi:hypothetical protein